MNDFVPEGYFTDENMTLDRGLGHIESVLNHMRDDSYLVNIPDEMPSRKFPLDFEQGFKGWIKDHPGNVSVLDIGAGVGKIASDVEVDPNLRNKVIVESIDKHPKSPRIRKVDVDGKLPYQDQQFDFSIASYVLPYLEDPVETLNEAIRITKSGGYILFNGANKCRYVDGVKYFFSSYPDIPLDKLEVYNDKRFSDGEWVLIKVVDPSYKIPFALDTSVSFTIKVCGIVPALIPVFTGYGGVENARRDIKDLAQFVYKPK
jgi:SAM-dependent methyltransferase